MMGDSFFSDQKIGISRIGEKYHGSPREAIIEAIHDFDLREYICTKTNSSSDIFDTVDWGGLQLYMQTLPDIRLTHVIKMTHDWIHDGQQKALFSTEGEVHLCTEECGIVEVHQHYIVCFALTMLYQKSKCMRDLQKVLKK